MVVYPHKLSLRGRALARMNVFASALLMLVRLQKLRE
jgi:hypothetical protein